MLIFNLRLKKRGIQSVRCIDLFFKSVVLSKLTDGLPVYGACNAELNVIRSFLNRCFRRNYTSIPMNFWNNMIKDYFIQQISATHYIHFSLIRLRTLHCGYNKEQVNCMLKVNIAIERCKNSFVNRSYFGYKLPV